MPHVAVRATFGYARHHRQDRLLAIECLDLALLIDAEDEGSVGRGKVKGASRRDQIKDSFLYAANGLVCGKQRLSLLLFSLTHLCPVFALFDPN